MAQASDTDLSVPFSLRQLPDNYSANSVGNVDIFNTTNIDAPSAYNGSVQSVWDQLADAPGKALDAVENTASNAWMGVKDSVKSTFTSISDSVGGAINTTLMYVLLGIAVLVGAIYLIGKSGAIGQTAGLVSAGYGMGA